MSYNVLAPSFARSGFEYCPPAARAWEYRCALIRAEVCVYAPDVVCMQEVEARAFERQWKGFMAERGYTGAFCAYAERGGSVGVATFCRDAACVVSRTHRLRMRDLAVNERVAGPLRGEECCAVRLPFGASSDAAASPSAGVSPEEASVSDGAEEGGTPCEDASPHEHCKMWNWLSRMHHVALVVDVRVRPSACATHECADAAGCGAPARRLLIGNFHAYWNPQYPEIKALQTALVVRGMAALCDPEDGEATAEHALTGFLLCGDFNSLPRIVGPEDKYDHVRAGETLISGVYGLMTRGVLPREHPHHPFSRRVSGEDGRHHLTEEQAPHMCLPLAFESAYVGVSGEEPEWTNWHWHSFKETLDYIWYGTSTCADGGADDALQRAFHGRRLLHLTPVASLDPPSSAAIRRFEGGSRGGCPNEGVPSDHIPILADFMVP